MKEYYRKKVTLIISFIILISMSPGCSNMMERYAIDRSKYTVSVTPVSGLTVTEDGDQAYFSIKLDIQPVADVTINLTSSNTSEGTVSPASLIFTMHNWDTPQTATITGQNDDASDGSQSFTIVTSPVHSKDSVYHGVNPPDVSVTNSDDETAGITVNPVAGLTTSEAGGQATFTIRLNSEPAGDVTINLSSSDTAEGTVSPAGLTFTSLNWNTAQIVIVTGQDDDIEDGNQAYMILTSPAVSADPVYNGMGASDINLTNIDKEVIVQNAIGATTSTTLRTLGFSPLDDNSIFVSSLSGSDISGTGTQANPVASINKAIGLCDALHQKVVILDSETYIEKGFEFIGNFRGLYAALGQKPKIIPDWNSASRDNANVISPSIFNNNSTNIVVTATLNNGNFVICYSDSIDGNKGKFSIYSQEGALINGPVTFENGSITYEIDIEVLNNGKFVIAYGLGSDWFGNFVIYNENGTVSLGRTEFEPGTAFSITLAVLNNGNFIICYQANDINTSFGRFRIYDQNGTQQAGPIVFGEGIANVSYYSIGVLSNNNWVIAYGGANNTSLGKFYIFDQNGSAISGPITFQNTSTRNCNIAVLSNGNWLVAYHANDGMFVIYDSSGSLVTGPVNLNSGYISNIKATAFDEQWRISYIDNTDLNHGKSAIFSNSGTLIAKPSWFYSKRISRFGINKLNNGNIVYAYVDMTAGNAGLFSIIYPNSWNGIQISSDAEINGIILDANQLINLTKLIKVTSQSKLSLKHCDLLGTSQPVPSFTSISGYSIFGYGDIEISNSKIYNNDVGIYIENQKMNILDSHFYLNSGTALHFNGSAAQMGDITINHADFFKNNIGLRLENNNGANEIVKNSIFHKNTAFGINVDSPVTLSYSVITDPVQNALLGTNMVNSDPLYLNEGATNPDEIDLHLKSILSGFLVNSPAKGLADDIRNAGAYDVKYIGE